MSSSIESIPEKDSNGAVVLEDIDSNDHTIDANSIILELQNKYQKIGVEELESLCGRTVTLHESGVYISPPEKPRICKRSNKRKTKAVKLVPNQQQPKKTTFGRGQIGLSCEKYGVKNCQCCIPKKFSNQTFNKLHHPLSCSFSNNCAHNNSSQINNSTTQIDLLTNKSAHSFVFSNDVTPIDLEADIISRKNYSIPIIDLTNLRNFEKPSSSTLVKVKKEYTVDEIMNFVDNITTNMDSKMEESEKLIANKNSDMLLNEFQMDNVPIIIDSSMSPDVDLERRQNRKINNNDTVSTEIPSVQNEDGITDIVHNVTTLMGENQNLPLENQVHEDVINFESTKMDMECQRNNSKKYTNNSLLVNYSTYLTPHILFPRTTSLTNENKRKTIKKKLQSDLNTASRTLDSQVPTADYLVASTSKHNDCLESIPDFNISSTSISNDHVSPAELHPAVDICTQKTSCVSSDVHNLVSTVHWDTLRTNNLSKPNLNSIIDLCSPVVGRVNMHNKSGVSILNVDLTSINNSYSHMCSTIDLCTSEVSRVNMDNSQLASTEDLAVTTANTNSTIGLTSLCTDNRHVRQLATNISSISDVIEIHDDSFHPHSLPNVIDVITLDDSFVDENDKIPERSGVKIDKKVNLLKNWNCPVCLDDLQNKKKMATICGHIFCATCLRNVIKTTKQCPNCRKKLTSLSIHPLYI